MRAVSTYAWRYAQALRQPFVFLLGQLLTFFAVSLYVKLVQMRLTPEYAGLWVTSGRFWTNCLHAVLFCGQEIGLFVGLLIATALWRRCNPAAGTLSRCVAWTLGLAVLPILSAIEVMGVAHYAYFLTPLGQEEVRSAVWAPMIVSSSNVFDLPTVIVGTALVVIGYHLAPCALWMPLGRVWERLRAGHAAALLVAGVLAVALPTPMLADALLAPHPLLWMLFGNRSQPGWAATGTAQETLAGHSSRTARPRFSVKQHPKNVLILLLESTRAKSVAVYNPKASAGQSLLRFADEMVVFDNVYAPVPTSAHAMFSILYGIYPYLGPFWSTGDKSVVADSLAQLFGRAGYTTNLYVTADLNYDAVRSYAATGFDHVLDPNDWPGQEQYALLPWGRDDRLLIEETKRFLSSVDKQPFFLFAFTSNPHHPYAADQLFPDAPVDDDHASYERLVDYDLNLVAELYDWMKAHGKAEDTLLLVLGDHGEAFGEHAGNYGHAAFIYEENVHVPCFILHPRRLGLPHHIAQLGSQIDLRPTILEILGMRDTAPGDGMSLLHEDPARIIAHFTENGVSHFGVRDARFSYIYTPHGEVEHMFDRRTDPREQHDLASHQPTIAARYRTRLQRWEAQHQLSLAKVLR